MATWAATAALVLASVAFALLIGEGAARLIVNPGDFLSATLEPHSVLGVRIKPHTTGHDALGFRNVAVPATADIVALGDSMTYGINAPRESSWPLQLSGLLDRPVYNMGLGSYGPLHYLHLSRHEARTLRPRTLLVGFYFGNDLVDAYSAAHGNPHWAKWRDARKGDEATAHSYTFDEPQIKRFGALRDWLSAHSVLYSILRVTLLSPVAAWEQQRQASSVSPDRQTVWTDPHDPAISTIFTPQLRLSALDLGNPEVQQGLSITIRAFATMQAELSPLGTKLVVVLIPTKESVYCKHVEASGMKLAGAFETLCEAEQRIRDLLSEALGKEGIAHVDVTGRMEEEVRKHVPIYPPTSDAHPVASGYRAIALEVRDYLRSSALKP